MRTTLVLGSLLIVHLGGREIRKSSPGKPQVLLLTKRMKNIVEGFSAIKSLTAMYSRDRPTSTSHESSALRLFYFHLAFEPCRNL